ncbi:cell wall elongation regulator TseB-like domain-containing protein [Lactococcus nasutitermitis]|nr:DUF5590 domain-containing protein [Lactococcus nasutitermitis]
MKASTQIIIGALTVIIAIYIAIGLFLNKAISPYNTTRAQAINIAKKETNLKTAQSFDIATTDITTYAIKGLDKNNKEIGVIIPQKSGKITVVDMDKGVAPTSLTSKNTSSVVLTLYKGKAAWEVNSSNNYKVYDFTTGKELIG